MRGQLAPPDRRRLARLRGWLVWYVGAALVVTAGSAVLNRAVAMPTGLRRAVYPAVEFAGTPLAQETVPDVGLAFLDQRPELPQRFVSVRWQGVWFFPRAQTVDVYAGADDQVDLRVDGELVLRRSPEEGTGTTSRPLTLGAGAHDLVIEYQQGGGDLHLNVQWAPAGDEPRPLPVTRLFPHPVTPRQYWLTTGLGWLTRLLPALWLALPAALLLAPAARLARVAVRAARHRGRRWLAEAAPHSLREFFERASLAVLPALLAPAVLFGLGPHTIYAANRDQFSVSFTAVAYPWLLASLGASWALLLAVGGVAALLSERAVRLYAALLFAVGMLAWAQGNLWVGDYGPLDGREIDWHRLEWRVPYELAVWIVTLAIALACWRTVARMASFAVALFLGLQAAAMGVSSRAPGADQPRWTEPPTALYQFSATRNVIHIVLDEFQSDLLAEMIEGDRAWFDRQFDGFVYFADHLGAFPTTSLSMPAMLTGQEYRNERPVPEFVRQAFQTSVFERLSALGFEVDVASILNASWLESWFGSGESKTGSVRFAIRKPFVSQRDYRRFVGHQLVELSVLRHVPHLSKVALSENPAWFDRVFWRRAGAEVAARRYEAANSSAFFQDFIQNATLAGDRPRYKLLHLGLPHRPTVLDRDCRFLGVTTFSRQAYLDQSRCSLELVAMFLDRLRALGIYDSSLLIVSSDHGTDLEPLGFFGKSGSLPSSSSASTSRLTAIAGTAKALMLIKPPARTGSLIVSAAPTAHIDLPATILDLLGERTEALEGSMFRRDQGKPRRRTYGMYDVRQRFPKAYLNRLDLLRVEGRLEDASGWHHVRTILPPGVRLNAQAIDLGTEEAAAHLGPGWSLGDRESVEGSGEVSFVWGLGEQATLLVSLAPGTSTLMARLAVAPGSGLETIRVELDGRVLERWALSGRDGYHDYRATIPPNPDRPPVSALTFHFTPAPQADVSVKLDRVLFQAK